MSEVTPGWAIFSSGCSPGLNCSVGSWGVVWSLMGPVDPGVTLLTTGAADRPVGDSRAAADAGSRPPRAGFRGSRGRRTSQPVPRFGAYRVDDSRAAAPPP